MSSEIILPELAESMTSATLTTWLKEPGDSVRLGEPVAEVETDKTTVEIEAPADGILDQIHVEAGTEDVAVGTVLAVLRDVERETEETSVDKGVVQSDVSGSEQAGTMEVRLPEMAESMAVATVTTWLRQPGQTVRTGEPLAEIETDKTTVELESPADGTLDVIHIAAGTEDVPVDTVLATLRLSEGIVETRDGGLGQDKAVSTVVGATPPRPVMPEIKSDDEGSTTEAIAATPLARQMSALVGLDLARVTGTGLAGQVTKADIERQLGSRSSNKATTTPLPDVPHADESLTAMRRVTAERMTMSKQTVPHFYLELSCSVEDLLARRERANAVSGANAITINDLLVRAAGLALATVPEANSTWTGDAVRIFESVDIAVAVSTPSGLVT
ncbi:MAG: biotin/lipoyl-containing protein, partial [Acidobacteriota bacterium]|nr:biotin/lipoyl-containing protein [Acidobacteriota bacterium]